MALSDAAASPLPGKDMAVYRATQKLFEHKQYKRGLKACDQLLRRHPSHAETQAMRALFLAHIGGRRDEAHAQAREALRSGVRSYVCWLVYGMIHRVDKNYPEALKAFRSAARIEEATNPPGNPAVIRDVAVLQTQLRMYPALVDTRQQLLAMRPALRMHWVALAVAYDLAGAHGAAADLVGTIRANFSIEEHVPAEVLASGLVLVEEAGLQMYRVDCLLRAGRLDEALEQLSAAAFCCGKKSPHILPVDHASVLLLRGKTLLRRGSHGDKEAARALGMRLLEANSDSLDALLLVLATVPGDDTELRHSLVEDMRRAHPDSLMLRSAALQTAPPSSLGPMLTEMLLPMLDRGVPSASSLLYDAERVFSSSHGSAIAERVAAVDAFCAELEDKLVAGEGHIVAGHLLLGQHWSRRGEHMRAVLHLEHALEHAGDDTVMRADVLLSYARALDAAAWRGNAQPEGLCVAAMRAANAVRELQPADRYANSMTVRYALRAGQVIEAKTVAARFLRVRPPAKESKNAVSEGSPSGDPDCPDGDDADGSIDVSLCQVDDKEDEEEFVRASRAPECLATDASPAIEDQLRDLTDMQASWYLLELGAAQHALAASLMAKARDELTITGHVDRSLVTDGPFHVNTLRAAVHAFAAVLRHHADFCDDQFDFHNYAFRRSTLSAYVSGLLHWEDTGVYASPAYYAAAVGYLVCRQTLRSCDLADGAAMAALSLEDKHASALDELAIVERLVAYHGSHAVSHVLALDVWLRRGQDVTSRLVRSLCAGVSIFARPLGMGAIRRVSPNVVAIHVEPEHICDVSTGAVSTRVLSPKPLHVDIASLRKRIDNDMGNASVRTAMHRALDYVCDATVADLPSPSVHFSIETPVLDRMISATPAF